MARMRKTAVMAAGTIGQSKRVNRRLLVNAIASLASTLAGYGFAWFGYDGYPPAANRLIWGIFSALLFGYWTILIILAASMKHPERIPGWRHARRILELGTFAGVMGVTILFMPWGTAELQHVTLLYSTSYCAAAILSSIDEENFVRWRIVAVMGGLAAVCVMEQIPLWPFLTAYLLIFGSVLMVFDLLMRRSMLRMRAARAEAVAARDARTRFVAAAAHDLGQPLQAARLFFEQAIRAPTSDARSTAAAHTRNAFFGMEELLHAMLDHLRLSTGTVAVAIEPLPVMPLIAGCAARYGAVAASEGVRLVPLPTHSMVRGDRALIERALGNLIDNALRHADASRVLIGAWRRPNAVVRLFVADDGRGLGNQDVEALFDDYVQADEGGGPTRGGFGIGLGSTRRAAQAMGGTAGHDPDWHAGALFYLDLPADEQHTTLQWGAKLIPA